MRREEKQRAYICIDLKSFYASVECMERGLDPLTTNLVVADESRTEKTICLAVSPALKAYGIPGRPRLFEVIQQVKRVNAGRLSRLSRGAAFSGSSTDAQQLQRDPSLAVDFVTAPPRMALYMEYSTRIYQIYLRYIAPEDMHVYSIDEVFIDATDYLHACGMTAEQLCATMIRDVLRETGITATGGVGTNLYLGKAAMDLAAKHMPPNEDGVRIASLDEMSYRRLLWTHRPLTDFWRVGRGYARKLEKAGLYTMGDIARCSLENEDLLYGMFGVNAELLIDHAWGYENVGMADIKAYRPENNSVSAGQVLPCAYTAEQARLTVREMADMLALDLVDRGLTTNQMVLTAGYDIACLSDPEIRRRYHGEIVTDRYGRSLPKSAHGSINLGRHTSSTKQITDAVMQLYDRIVNPDLLVRRMTLAANHVTAEQEAAKQETYEQLSLFTDCEEREKQEQALERERRAQKAVLEIQKKYGKNALLKGMNLQEGATARTRNSQIGGHKA